jgi:hydrogenase-4 component B
VTSEACSLAALLVLMGGAVLALACGSRSGAAGLVAVAASAAAAVLGLCAALPVLRTGVGWDVQAPWSLPWATLSLGIDGLSAFFLAFILVLAVPAAAYGRGYLAHRGPSTHGSGAWTSASWAFFQVLVASMALVVLARDGVLFLIAWEGMSVASFFLVIYDHERPEVRSDALVYLVATHLGAAALMAMFGLWGSGAGSLTFEALAAAPLSSKAAWAVFLLALAGFGSKAGLAPFHIWLPRAHPAAPSHVSALMSGVMIKMGIYGLMRVLLMLGPPPLGWGYTLLAMGAVSAVGGVLYALAQHDLKRLLAYHSVENVGIIVLGLGAGLVARSAGMETVAVVAFSGSLLHVLNHGLFKSLLFYSGGAAAQAAGTRDMERLGGLLRRMPVTGATFIAGAVAICALPPFNGFVSEWLVYSGLFSGALQGKGIPSAVLFVAIPVLALVGGLALACFAKAAGVVFLGEPRSEGAAACKEVSPWMTVPMVFTALACAGVGLAAPWVIATVVPAARALAGLPGISVGSPQGMGPLSAVVLAGWALLALTGVLLGARRLFLRGRTVTEAPTWGCGFTAPTPRMQYTASSFAAPLLAPLARLMWPSLRKKRPKGIFPKSAAFRSHYDDLADRGIFDPAVRLFDRLSGVLRPLQHGRLQVYLLYVLLTLVALVVWEVLA